MVLATARRENDSLPSAGPLRFPADYLEVHGKVRINPARNLHTPSSVSLVRSRTLTRQAHA